MSRHHIPRTGKVYIPLGCDQQGRFPTATRLPYMTQRRVDLLDLALSVAGIVCLVIGGASLAYLVQQLGVSL